MTLALAWVLRAGAVAALVAVGAGRLWAQEPIFASVPAWTGPTENTLSVAVGDVDGDGDLDLVRGNNDQLGMYPQGTTLYLNTGGVFAATPSWSGRRENTRSVALGDVDGDGDLDLVCGNMWGFNGVAGSWTLYLNAGGSFGSTPAGAGDFFGVSTSSVVLGDVDGDGDLDLVRGGSPTTLHLNVGGTFASVPPWTGPSLPTWVRHRPPGSLV